MRTFCSSEDTVKSEKAMHEWEKIFAIHLPNKGLVSIVSKSPTSQQEKYR